MKNKLPTADAVRTAPLVIHRNGSDFCSNQKIVPTMSPTKQEAVTPATAAHPKLGGSCTLLWLAARCAKAQRAPANKAIGTPQHTATRANRVAARILAWNPRSPPDAFFRETSRTHAHARKAGNKTNPVLAIPSDLLKSRNSSRRGIQK